MNFFNILKNKIISFFEREPRKVRLIVWRDRLTKLVMFVDDHFNKVAVLSILILFFVLFMNVFFWRAPSNFPDNALITVERGAHLSEIADSFKEKSIVRSDFWLKFFIIMFGGERNVTAGDYYFPEPVGVWKVAKVLRGGEFGLIPIRITIFEGTSSYEIASLLEKELPAFSSSDFLSEVDKNKYEGYLFPDTYFFMPNTKSSDVILMMRENFARQIKEYEEDLVKSGRTINDIVIMASLLEGEGNTLDSKRMIADILWRRVRLGMPLQVDAPFKYYNGKNSYTLTKDDLSEDHPYNTYVNKGLPPTAINNPGVDSLRAAIAPTSNSYMYFLSDKNGNIYYAKDFEGHKRNRELYLN